MSFLSQAWQGSEWAHSLVVVHPDQGLIDPDVILLEISGDDVGAPDDEFCKEMANRTGYTVVMLLGVPAQPLWDRREDDLIAHTFEMFLESRDPHDLLLTPMVRSVLSAMTLVNGLKGSPSKFILTGASKRGWTAWLAAATADPRIIGIAPRVFDNLRMIEQVQRQESLWGSTSEMIDDYVRRQLHLIASTEYGQELVELVDPASYLKDIDIPALVINGANDAYWAPDALSLYADDLPEDSRQVCVPNLGHSNLLGSYWMPALGEFCSAVSSGGALPQIRTRFSGNNVEISCTSEPKAVKLWEARSRDNVFWDKSFEATPLEPRNQIVTLDSLLFESKVIIVEAEFSGAHQDYRLTSVPRLIQPRS